MIVFCVQIWTRSLPASKRTGLHLGLLPDRQLIRLGKLALQAPGPEFRMRDSPARPLRLSLEQSEGSTAAAAIYEIIGQPVTKNEMAWITEIREASGDTDPRLTSRAGAAIRGLFGK